MKLEIEINSAQNSSLENISDNLPNSETRMDEVKKMLRSGINLAKEGNRAEARQMLLKVTEAEPENETAWLWLASISEYPEELLIFLQNVLKVNPNNERALEWAKQTKTLLSKTFVQRGINASRDNQKEFAKQCFLQGIVHDDNNEMAWLWLASTSDSPEEKLSNLQRVLQINPENETALSSLNAVRSQMSQALLKKANSAAIAGDRETSRQILETIMKHTPNLEEAWILKAYLTDEYYEKIQFYQKALEINPESEAGQAGLSSLQLLAQKATKPVPEAAQKAAEESSAPVENQLAENEWAGADNEWSKAQTENSLPEVEPEHEAPQFAAETHDAVEESPEFEQPVGEMAAGQAELEAVEQPVELAENQDVTVEQTMSEPLFAEEPRNEPEQFLTAETAAETEAEAEVAEDHRQVVETVEPLQNFVRPNPQFQVEESALDAQVEPDLSQMENGDSPTQELDEEFARTADAVFNSYQESEPVTEENPEPEAEAAAETADETPELEAEMFEAEAEKVEAYAAEELSPAEQTQSAAFEPAEEQFVEYNDDFAEGEERFVAGEVEETHVMEESVEEMSAVEETDSTAAVEETAPVPETVESYSYESPYFSGNGFEMVSADERFADYQRPTVELSSAEFAEMSAPANEYFEQQREKSVPTESFNNEIVNPFEPERLYQPNGFAIETPVEVRVEEVAPAAIEENPAVEEISFAGEARVVEDTEPQAAAQSQLAACPFCQFENEAQNIVCHSCQSMLSLSDLEMMLAHHDANQDLLLSAIERMEVERTLRDFGVEEMTTLGLAYLNARNLRKGFSYLREASGLNPNDVVLGSKVNFLAIRLNEIEEHDTKVQETPFQSRTILVVDDSPTVRKLISGKLEKSGHSVISAVDGMDALAKINEVIPDLILLDITMPRLDGYQVCKLIRNNEVTKEIPIIMISGKDGFFDKVRGRMAGSTGYITKPFGPDTLMKTIETYLG